ncbi:hypothetical protein GCM10017566_05120 [Amycolatopsis bartoniae]|uniref:Uncharacterized protein n=1 Tax=Amycolatopsis bartoniae TaxID=941986 RepID=A0A8H9IUM9_9PSEU|nr:hypothetical protein GCM10017566_05120 [Amycolatopsis bartoniae]
MFDASAPTVEVVVDDVRVLCGELFHIRQSVPDSREIPILYEPLYQFSASGEGSQGVTRYQTPTSRFAQRGSVNSLSREFSISSFCLAVTGSVYLLTW